LLNDVVLRALWKIDVHLINTLVNKSLSLYIYLIYVKLTSSLNIVNINLVNECRHIFEYMCLMVGWCFFKSEDKVKKYTVNLARSSQHEIT